MCLRRRHQHATDPVLMDEQDAVGRADTRIGMELPSRLKHVGARGSSLAMRSPSTVRSHGP